MKHLLRALLVFMACIPVMMPAQTQMPLPVHSNHFIGYTRGYYFVAPCCFTITGVEVPMDLSNASQNIAIVRFDSMPPVFPGVTNSFTTLFLTQNDTTSGIIPCNIQVQMGDVIGVLGNRGNDNSYGAGGFVSNINGNPCTLNRLGMQYTLDTAAPQDLWSESGNISRVYLYYTTSPGPVAAYTYSVAGATVTFTNTTTGASGYLWDFGDTQTSTAANPTHTYSNTGNYTVCLVAWDTCGDTTTVCHTIPVLVSGIENFNANANATFYPNPFSGQSTLEVTSSSYTGSYTLGIYDMRGALVATQQGVIGERLLVDGSALAGGVYIYKVMQKGEILSTGKLVVSE